MILKHIFFIAFCCSILCAQPVRISLVVNTDLVDQTNITPVKTLEKAAQDFLNTTKWTKERAPEQSEISIALLLNISNINDNNYSGTLQIQSGRLVYNSSYSSPLINILDENFNFTYQEFQPFYFDVNRYNNNITSVLSYYVYLAIGMELDSYSLKGGTPYFERARTIANAAQASNAPGWAVSKNRNGRFELIDQLSFPAFDVFRNLIYEYHRNGLDVMTDQPLEAKQVIVSQLLTLEPLMRRQPNSYLIRAFFDSKAEEIGQLFSDGPETDTKDLLRFLNRFAPSMSSYWSGIER